MNAFPLAPPRIEPLSWDHKFHTTVAVLRLDRVHPVVSGNKWFKLHRYLADARRLGRTRLVTFGGPYSNHIIATAAAAREAGLSSTGLIRGEQPAQLSPTLRDAEALGMRLRFLPRELFDELSMRSEWPEDLAPPESYVVPHGGYGPLGAAGAGTILDLEGVSAFDHILIAVGTGTTLAGLAAAAGPHQQVIGIPVVRDAALDGAIEALAPGLREQWRLIDGYQFGGYARRQPELIRFMNELYASDGLPTDFVYTGKLFYAAHDLLTRGALPPNAKVLVVHSGGLQGNRSLRNGTLIF